MLSFSYMRDGEDVGLTADVTSGDIIASYMYTVAGYVSAKTRDENQRPVLCGRLYDVPVPHAVTGEPVIGDLFTSSLDGATIYGPSVQVIRTAGGPRETWADAMVLWALTVNAMDGWCVYADIVDTDERGFTVDWFIRGGECDETVAALLPLDGRNVVRVELPFERVDLQ